jgi:hypothetical protein
MGGKKPVITGADSIAVTLILSGALSSRRW